MGEADNGARTRTSQDSGPSRRRYGFFPTMMTSGLAALILFALGCAVGINQYVRPSLERQWGATTELLAAQFASLAGVALSELGQDLAAFAFERSPKDGKASMAAWLAGQRLVSSIYWLDSEGVVMLSASAGDRADAKFEGSNVKAIADFTRPEAGADGWGATYFSAATGARVVSRVVSVRSGYLVLEVDQEKLSSKLRADTGASDKLALALFDARGGVVAYSKPSLGEALSARKREDLSKQARFEEFVDMGKIEGRETLARFVPIPGVRGWKAGVFVDRSTVSESLDAVVKLLAAGLAVAAALGAMALYVLAKRLSNGILELEDRARAMAQGAPGSGLSMASSITEIASVASSLDRMFAELREREEALVGHQQELERQVMERSSGLLAANKELALAFDTLKRAQASLVESEKLASLGSLVAGVSHELNTPIGNAYLSATSLQARVEDLRTSVSGGRVSKREFIAALDGAAELARMACLNLERSADLIKSFKRVAVDQSTQRVQAFDLTALAKDAMASFQAGLDKRGGVTWAVAGEGVEVMSNPGLWIQLLSNFFNNALMHGFADGKGGAIEVRVAAVGDDEVELRFADDGEGMPEEVSKKAFDPFFTTKPGAGGGSGIGLHLCFNLVKAGLGGQLTLWSQPGRGTSMTVRAPRRRAPQVT